MPITCRSPSSFEEYFSGIEQGATISDQEYVLLSDELKRTVRDGVRHGLAIERGDRAFTIAMEPLIGSGRAPN